MKYNCSILSYEDSHLIVLSWINVGYCCHHCIIGAFVICMWLVSTKCITKSLDWNFDIGYVRLHAYALH